MRCRKSGVPAEIDLMRRCKPVQIPRSISAGFDECRLSQVVLLRNRQHQFIWQPVVKDKNSRRIPREEPVREGIDLIHVHEETPGCLRSILALQVAFEISLAP